METRETFGTAGRRSGVSGGLQTAARADLACRLRLFGLECVLHDGAQVRAELGHALRAYGLRAVVDEGTEPALWVECRPACAAADRALVYGVLDRLGWAPDCARLSRLQVRHDVLRVRHARTGAAWVVIIKTPAPASRAAA